MSEETDGKTADAEGKKKGKKKSAKSGKGSRMSKILIIVCGVLVLIFALFGGAYYMGIVHKVMGWERPQSKAELQLGKPILHTLPQIRTDLKSGECKAPFLRAIIEVQLSPEDLPRLEEAQEQIMDGILTHLREQDRKSVVGKAGSERLRFELVQIIENIIRPANIHTVLFKELIVQ